MSHFTRHSLEDRLDRVERENRRLKRAGAAALAVIAAVVLMGQATGSKVAKVVEAEKFVLRDLSGKSRAVLELSKDVVELNLLGKNGKNLAQLAAADFTSALTLRSDTGNPSLRVAVFAGLPTVWLHDKDGVIRAELGLGFDGKPHIFIADKFSQSGALLFEGDDGSMLLSFHDKAQVWRAQLGLESNGSPALSLYGADGLGRAVLGSTSLEAVETGVVEKRPESSLVLLNKAKKVIWRAP